MAQASAGSKIVSQLAAALGRAVAPDNTDDLKLTEMELIEWGKAYNRAMVENGTLSNLIKMYDSDGTLLTKAYELAVTAYAAEYIKNRQPIVTLRESGVGIAVSGPSHHYTTVKTKDRKMDEVFPRGARGPIVDRTIYDADMLAGIPYNPLVREGESHLGLPDGTGGPLVPADARILANTRTLRANPHRT